MNQTDLFNSKVVCDEIISQVKKSNVNFQLVETPFSLKLSIKKSPIKFYQNQTSIPPQSYPRADLDRDYRELKIKSENLETKNKAIEGDLKCAKDKVKDISDKNDVLESDLTYSKNENSQLREIVQDLEFEIKRLKEVKKVAVDVDKKSAVIDKLKGKNAICILGKVEGG